MGHNYLGGEHVLAGIAAQGGTRAACILADSGLGVAAVRAELDRRLGQCFLVHPLTGCTPSLRGTFSYPARSRADDHSRGRSM
jgi:hypothetical protein